ncbi:hypothetical protein [Neobacillus mesonae]|uniref:hypothetical protein n=1 Tax=Neobacillus mesonae TaxID=1193713 RepID=UPI00082BF2DE|nr:hypothetical protein [Neobacillus mesonae]
MFQTINGVQISEHEETKANPNLFEKRFEIEFLDHVYLNNLVCLDLININVKEFKRKFGRKIVVDHGRKWMYVVKHNDYVENRKKYGKVCSIIHEKIGGYLKKEYGFDPTGMFVVDSMGTVYVMP